MSVVATKTTIWRTAKGRELIRLNEDTTATVIPSACSADELDDLAEACTAAADALRLIGETEREV